MVSKKDGLAGSKEDDDPLGLPSCPVCNAQFSFPSQVRRHVRHKHPDFDAQTLPQGSLSTSSEKDFDVMQTEMNEDSSLENQQLVYNLYCSWCDKEYIVKEEYDEHLKEHGEATFSQYIEILQDIDKMKKDKMLSDEKSDEIITGENPETTAGEVLAKCNICGFVTKAVWALEGHLDSCHSDTSRTCWLCNQQCLSASSLREHVIHHFHGIKTCPLCPIKSSTRHHLISHVNICHPDCCITCKECDKEFNDYHQYEMHLVDCQAINAFRVCKICRKKVLAFDYYKHIEEHGDPLEENKKGHHSCNVCNVKFRYAAHLLYHKYHKHPENFSFKCDECERGCRTEHLLSLHKWGHKYGSHVCPVCRLKFRQVDQLKKHLLVAHPDQEGYTCKYCPLTLKNYGTFIAHCKLKHPKESGYNRPVKCKICGKLFDHKLQWKYHMRDHNNQELQTCKVCGNSVKNLRIHMNLHTKSEKFECGICGAVYHNKTSFHFHMRRVHMGNEVRKHICGTCHKRFLTAADLRIHFSRVHQGERKYWCSVCEKRYKSKVSLTYHERIHTGEKPHKCTLCDRTFHVPSYLQRHMEHDHRTQYTGVYFKQGRPKSQEVRCHMRRKHQQSSAPLEGNSLGQENGSIPEIVQITVPKEMGEVVAAVNIVQNVRNTQYHSDQDGVMFLVCERPDAN